MATSIKRDKLAEELDDYLLVRDIADGSPNGLQVQGAATITRVAFAVDASLLTIHSALKTRAQMLIVHHGLWWGSHEQIVGNMHARISALIKGNLSLYVAHLPLDCHPEVGNNFELARMLGLDVTDRFGEYKGTRIGVLATPPRPLPRKTLLKTMESELGVTPEALAFGPATVRRAAILTGEGALFAEEARRCGCDTLITGESSHSSYHMARESKVNLIFGGHYATETVGLRALERKVKKTYPVTTKFISAPTGY